MQGCACMQGVSGQVKERMEMAAAGQLPPTTRPLLLFPEVRSPSLHLCTRAGACMAAGTGMIQPAVEWALKRVSAAAGTCDH